MTLEPSYKNYGLWNRIGLSTLVTDETFGVAITPHLKGEKINDCWLHGLNITAYLFWTLASVVGAVSGKYIQNPDVFGLDFAIVGMFIFLAVSHLRRFQRSYISIYLILIVSVLVMMLLFSLIMPTYVAIILSSVIAACLGW